MVCFDYEEVRCSVCGVKTQDGYQILDGKVVCDECSGKTRSLGKEDLVDDGAGQLPWPSDAEAALLCADCLNRFREWDRMDVFEPCLKCQTELDAQMAPRLVRIRMPGETSPGGGRGEDKDLRAARRPRTALCAPRKPTKRR